MLFSRRRALSIPLILDPATVDGGGAAALAMVLAAHGRPAELEDLRARVMIPEGGTSALALLEAAREHGLEGYGVRVDSMADCAHLPPGSILHWEENYFVVLERIDDRDATILGPVFGRRIMDHAELHASFTGVALMFRVR